MSRAFILALTCNITSAGTTAFFFALRTFQSSTTVLNYDDLYGTTDAYRYATINGVKLALPSANGGMALPRGINGAQNGTAATGTGTANNSTYDEMLAIWDAFNGTGTTQNLLAAVPGWSSSNQGYFTSTPSTSGHVLISFETGRAYNSPDNSVAFVALQVL